MGQKQRPSIPPVKKTTTNRSHAKNGQPLNSIISKIALDQKKITTSTFGRATKKIYNKTIKKQNRTKVKCLCVVERKE